MRGEDGILKEVWNREGSGTCVIRAQKWEVTEERKRTKSKWGMRKHSLGRKGQRPSTMMRMHGDATTQPAAVPSDVPPPSTEPWSSLPIPILTIRILSFGLPAFGAQSVTSMIKRQRRFSQVSPWLGEPSVQKNRRHVCDDLISWALSMTFVLVTLQKEGELYPRLREKRNKSLWTIC